MSNSHKTDAAWYNHHSSPDDGVIRKANRNQIPQSEIPEELKEKVELLYRNTAGDRHGNNRKSIAEAKVKDRRAKRRQANAEFAKTVSEQL